MKFIKNIKSKLIKRKILLAGDVRYYDSLESDELRIVEIKKILNDGIYLLEKNNCSNCQFKSNWSSWSERPKELYEAISSLLETFEEIYRDPVLIRTNYQGKEKNELLVKITEVTSAISRTYYTNVIVYNTILDNNATPSTLSNTEFKKMIKTYEEMENEIRKQAEQLSILFNNKAKERLLRAAYNLNENKS